MNRHSFKNLINGFLKLAICFCCALVILAGDFSTITNNISAEESTILEPLNDENDDLRDID